MLNRTERSLRNYTDGLSWERGVSNYWGNALFRRCLQTAGFCQALNEAIEAVSRILDPEQINSMTAHYTAASWNHSAGYTQDAFDYYVTHAGKHDDMKCFYVQPDGTIAEDVYTE